MLKQLSRTLNQALIASLVMQICAVPAFAQGKKASASSSTRVSARNFSKLASKASSARGMKVAHYKRAETLSQTASLSVKDIPEEKIVSGSVAIAHSQSMIDHRDGSFQESRSVIFGMNVKATQDWNFSTNVSYSHDPRDIENIQGGFSDLGLGLGHKSFELADWLNGSYSFSLTLPTSKYSQEFQNLQASVGAGYRFSLTPVVLAKGFDFAMSFGASRHFHQFETDKSGRVLNQYGMRETVSGAYSYKDFTISTDLTLRHGFSYNGNVSQAFEHTEEIGYTITSRWGVSVGHTNSGAWFKPNGQDSNLKLIDEDNSIIYGSTSLTF